MVRKWNNITKTCLLELHVILDPRTKGFSKTGTLESNAYRSILSLATNFENNSAVTLLRKSTECSVILYYLAIYTDMFGSPLKDLSQLIKNTDVVFIGELIFRHLLLISTNAHSITEKREMDLVDRGVAMMAFLSLFNHSCCTQLLRSTISNYMVVYTIYPIKKDEQIFDGYGQHFAVTPKVVRQMELLKQYHFKCNCVACLENWPLYHELKLCYKPVQSEKYSAERIENLLEIMRIKYESEPMPNAGICEVAELLKHAFLSSGNIFDIPEL